jgi:hypothetical protein
MKTFGLKEQIVFTQEAEEQPAYLTDETKFLDITKTSTARRRMMKAEADVEMSQLEEMLSRTELDPSQQMALAHALAHKLAIIQGPPGCGKTFVGIRLVEMLLTMRPRPPLPILVLTYKNHALDEFLKGLLGFLSVSDMVRVGGRSQEERLDSCNIRNLERQNKDYEMLDQINSLKDELRTKNEEVKQKMVELQAGSQLSMQDLLEAWTEDQLRDFLLAAPYGKKAISVSIGKKAFADGQYVKNLLDTVASVRNTLQSCFRKGTNNSNEQQLQQLFEKVLQYWMPSSEILSQLRQLQSQFVSHVRSAKEGECQALVEEEDAELELVDEEVIESVLENRMSAQGKGWKNRQPETRAKVTLFDQDDVEGFVVHYKDFPPKMEENVQLLKATSFWDCKTVQKICLLYTVLSQKIEELSASLSEELEELDLMTQSLDEFKAKMKARLMAEKKVIGMTITGASINQQLLQEIAPAIVIVEEAAEVLEADLIAALSPGLQHLVLIGDHKQLRPNVDTYKLRKDYNFDVSMMERLICNKFPFQTLTLQNRMRPEFSALLRDIYPHLQDNLARVSNNQPADGLVKSMFFWDHQAPEEVGRSKSNVEECRRAVLLAEYLMSTGIKGDRITILSAYQGQITTIRTLLTKRKQTNMHGNQTSDSRVQLSTIDRFQGDENDFVIVSLVRSNKKGDIGFLAAESRRCVAQSRARCGMYFIGSAATLTHKQNSAWISLVKALKNDDYVSDSLAVQCVKHKSVSVAYIKNADEFEHMLGDQEKLCKLACGSLFSCGLHMCTKPCLPTHPHASCMTKVSFTHKTCGHEGEKRCYEDAATIPCEKRVLLQWPLWPVGCGHQEEVKCSQKQRHDRGFERRKCKTKIDIKLPACGHPVTKPCHLSPKDIICKSVVYYTGECGHELSKECYLQASQVQCEFRPCGKTRSCGHPCVNKCGQHCDAGECSACKIEHEIKLKKNRHKAKVRIKKLEEQMKTGSVFSRKDLQERDPEYMEVHDRVTKYVLSMHNWDPYITRIEKVHNTKLEILYEEYRSVAFGDHEDRKFHGTDDAGVQGITEGGFRIGKPGMYGAGIYFATDSSKSGQKIYTKGSNKLLLCQVFLGRAKTVFKADHALTKDRLRKEGYDSVFAPRDTKDTGGVLNDEFVVFDVRQAYAKYIIHYQDKWTGHANINRLLKPGEPFRIERMVPTRTVNIKNPLEYAYRCAESHFHRMVLKYRDGLSQDAQISAISVVINPELTEKFEKKEKAFQAAGKGWFML